MKTIFNDFLLEMLQDLKKEMPKCDKETTIDASKLEGEAKLFYKEVMKAVIENPKITHKLLTTGETVALIEDGVVYISICLQGISFSVSAPPKLPFTVAQLAGISDKKVK